MGVFKWLRRERVTVTTRRSVTPPSTSEQKEPAQGTIRTEEYKRDLAEFQARRSLGAKELPDTPEKLKRCGHSSLPIPCADCTDPDKTFNYETKSANKYKKKKRSHSITPEKVCEGVPNIQFLFQNQVFMPGLYQTYSEANKPKCYRGSKSPDFVSKQLAFKEEEHQQVYVSPKFRKNSSLPFDVQNFLEGHRTDEEEVDGLCAAGDVNASGNETNKDSVSDEKVWEVLTELKQFDQWADEQLMPKSPATSRSDDGKSDSSAYGLQIVSSRNLDINIDKEKTWSLGTWGVVPVQVKKLNGVTVDRVRKKRSVEINILRKCRHPNIILLMGIYSDMDNNVHIICERCVDSLFYILHVQGRILSAQTSVKYALDIANALVFLRMQGFLHTQLNSASVMVTSHDSAKLADFGPCVSIDRKEDVYSKPKDYEIYTAEPRYVNIDDTHSKTSESEPLLSANPSEVYLQQNAISKPYEDFVNSEMFRWQAPELFVADEMGMVQPCSKSDAYSLALILWECCNASIPWKTLTYSKLKEQYGLWETGLRLPQDGTYPGRLLSVLQSGLKLKRNERIDLDTLQRELQTVKRDLDDIDYIIIPARIQRKKSNFSTTVWDTVSPSDSECQSPQNIEHKAVVHAKDVEDSSSLSEVSDKDSKSDVTPLYETIKKTYATYSVAQRSKLPDYIDNIDCSAPKYDLLPDKDFSSACSTPIAKLRARIKDIDTPGALHRSDSTEYCSILSPNRTVNFFKDDSKEQSCERSTTKLSRSFTPKSYKPLHIKVPECKLDSIKPLLKDQNDFERSSYNFDIKNYSLPTTPIARSNKLRKNAWLSGELRSSSDKESKTINETPPKVDENQNVEESLRTPETEPKSSVCSPDTHNTDNKFVFHDGDQSPPSIVSVRFGMNGFKRVDPIECADQDTDEPVSSDSARFRDEEALAGVGVRPLVARHERWIYEANRRGGRAMSLPENNSLKSQVSALKPASHCVDTLQKSLPQLNTKKNKTFRRPLSPHNNGGNWEQFCQARETISRGLNLTRDTDRYRTWSKDLDKATVTDERLDLKVNRSTDTVGIEDYIRDLIRKEFQHLIHGDDENTTEPTTEDELTKGVANIIESLNSEDPDRTIKKEPPKGQSSFSRVKINGNNKPLLQITFNRAGENSLQVLDNCVNVTICDNGKDSQKFNVSLEDTLSEETQVNALKRCQAFNAIQEARSTEDLYIDDDLSVHMNENFGGKVKLIPLHGSLHEILCERQDDCCLVKVKQENGCDTIYFRCDTSDTESRDALDGADTHAPRDTLLYKRRVSLVEERIQRIVPRDKRTPRKEATEHRPRPKSEIFAPIKRETRFFSVSSPSLATTSEVEVNIENVMSYQDSSSDECLSRSPDHDDFEVLEKKIEQEVKINSFAAGLGYLDKISEENLAVLNEE